MTAGRCIFTTDTRFVLISKEGEFYLIHFRYKPRYLFNDACLSFEIFASKSAKKNLILYNVLSLKIPRLLKDNFSK